jgi:Tfp pilus assembly protein FimT
MEMLIVIVLFAIVASLGHALFSMSTQQTSSKAMVNALTMRISLSLALFALLFISWHFGWIEPHQVRR